ncbi:MAG: M20/M25/M40 family metallo-hydrolase [Gemmatimonadales bacterium]
MYSSDAIRRFAAGLVWLAACGPAPAPPAPRVSADEVREIVAILAADSLEGRRTGSPGSLRASRFLAQQMRSYGLEPGGDSGYFQKVSYEAVTGPEGEMLRLAGTGPADSAAGEPITDYNLIGLVRGSDPQARDQAVVLGAHFDHVGIGKPVAGDSVYNGADDDASGVAVVLAAARALAKAPPRRTVIVLLTSGEEFGVLGTQWYLERPTVPLARTIADLQVEMVGRPDSLAGGPGKLWLTGYERSSMGESFARAGLPVVADPRPEFRFFERSDNIVFALRGIPAHTLSSFGLHSDYHQPSDEVDRIDFAHLAQAADLVARAARILADSAAPEWRPAGRPAASAP